VRVLGGIFGVGVLGRKFWGRSPGAWVLGWGHAVGVVGLGSRGGGPEVG